MPSQNKRVVQKIIEMDYKSAIWFYNLTPKLKGPFKVISLLGTIQFWIIVSVIFFVLGALFDQSIENFSVVMFMGIGVSLCTVTVLKVIVKRKRPYQDDNLQKIFQQQILNREPYISKAQQSFPSGHMFYWLMELIFFYYQFGPWILIPFLLGLPIIFTSRLYLGVHYLSDTIVGSLMGIIFGLLTQFVFKLWILPLYTTWIAVLL